MSSSERESTSIHKVVVNQKGQYSIWPADRENPLGWRDVGKSGPKAECLAYIKEEWTDMRPLNLRKRMEEISQSCTQDHSSCDDRSASEHNCEAARPALPYVHELFEARASATPQAPAVVFGDQTLTYRQLSQRANQLANDLQTLGVGPDTLVGIYMERCPEMIVSLLGVLIAGGAYLPLDLLTPPERVAGILKDSKAAVLLTQRHLRAQLPHVRAQVCCLDEIKGSLATTPTTDPAAHLGPANLAYVIYTSGSTGTPKGVMISHDALAPYTLTACEAFQLTPADRVLQFSSIGFDAAAEEIYPTLAAGATLVLRTDDMLGSAHTFFRACRNQRITVLDLPTAYWHQLTSELGVFDIELPPTVRLVVIGGERAMLEKWRAWQTHVGRRVRLLNTYGPTESTIVAVTCDLSAHEAKGARVVPIGRPISNVQAYALDERLRPVPEGVPGELYLGGVGLARGYLNRSDLTAESFVPNPFGGEPGTRLYKTGDLVSYLPDGNLEFMGRIDHQVKIRGYRIELGEIEAVLAQHSAVQQAVVLAREGVSDEKRLVAYIVPTERQNPAIGELRGFLRQKLPGYMIPSAFMALDALPLTPNGKVDRDALPEPDTMRTNLEAGFMLPRDDLETRITRIWEEILGVQPIGVRDDFFDLGGHSLLAVRLFARIEEAFGKDCSLATFFHSPTVEHLADILRHGESSVPRFNRAETRSVRFTPGKGTLWSGLRNRFFQIIALYVPGAKTTRVWLHRMRGVQIGDDVFIGPGVILESSWPRLVSIGNHVIVGTRSVFIAHFMGTAYKAKQSGVPSVRVEDNAFIGPAVVILPNVTIGQGAVVAAGSIVNRSVPPGVMVQGNPAVPVARCGIPLVGSTYEEFLRKLKIIKDDAHIHLDLTM